MAHVKWRTRFRAAAFFYVIFIQSVYGYEDMYTISHLSPKSSAVDRQQKDNVLETSRLDDLVFDIEPSVLFEPDNEEIDFDPEVVEPEHIIVARSANYDRSSRSINIDELPTSNNNEIDAELEIHNKRKYYDIHPTKTIDFLNDRDVILRSEGFGDRLDFKFPGEAERVPRARALPHQGPLIKPTAVQPVFATMNPNHQARQNTAELQNIITGIVKLLNGNVNVQANSQLLRPGRPMNSRINNRGPPRIADVPPLPDFAPVTAYVPTKTPPPYPFDRPPHLPEQITPPARPGFHRPLPPWHRPRPRPIPNRRPPYKPVPIPQDKNEDILVLGDPNAHLEIPINESNDSNDNTTEVNTERIEETTTEIKVDNVTEATTTEKAETTTEASTTTTTEKTTTTTTTTTTTEKPKEKPAKIEKDKKKEVQNEKERQKHKVVEDKQNKTKNETEFIQSSMTDKPVTASIATLIPTEALPPVLTNVDGLQNVSSVTPSAINSQPLPASQGIPYHPYRPRPGIVLDDPDFKPHGTRHPPYRGEASVITALDTKLPGGYGEIFDVTVSAIQGPGEKASASVHIQNVNPLSGQAEHDDIIVTPSGDQGFVSIDGKRTYLNLFGDSNTVRDVQPTRVQRPAGPSALPAPPHGAPHLGTGVAIPSDDVPQVPQTPQRRPAPGHSRPPGYRRPQPPVRIDTCIVGDDSTCDAAQNEKCRTEAGISSCQCRPGYAKRTHRDPCRRVVSLVLNLRVDRLYDRKVAWDMKLADKDSEPYQTLSYEALRAIDSAFSMTPFSDDFVGGTVNSVHRGDENNKGVYVNYTILMQETAETVRSAIATDIQRHLLGVIRRRSNNVGASALWVDSVAGSVFAPTDLDECSSPEFNDCHKSATCTNTWGGFRCTCPHTTRDSNVGDVTRSGRDCQSCANSHCNDRGTCQYSNGQPYCSCNSGYYGSTCEVDGEVVGVAVGASLAAALVIALTLAALLSWSRKWSREQKAAGMGSPVFSYMAGNTIKTPPVGQPPYQISLEERMRWAQIAEAMAANHYAQPDPVQAMATRPSSAMFGGYPTLPPVPLPRSGLYSHHGTLNTVASRVNTAASHHNLYGYTNHAATESTSSEASSHVQERAADLLVPRPKSRARSMHNQTGIYYDVEYENAPEALYGTKGIPLSTYTVSRGPPFYRT